MGIEAIEERVNMLTKDFYGDGQTSMIIRLAKIEMILEARAKTDELFHKKLIYTLILLAFLAGSSPFAKPAIERWLFGGGKGQTIFYMPQEPCPSDAGAED
jgi:hypothetical protein